MGMFIIQKVLKENIGCLKEDKMNELFLSVEGKWLCAAGESACQQAEFTVTLKADVI